MDRIARENPLALFPSGYHSKQLLAHQATEKHLFIYGGNRSGKTEFGVIDTLKEWTGDHEYRWLRPRKDGGPCLVWICSETGDVQRDTLQKKFDRFMPKSWIVKNPTRAGVWMHTELLVPNVRYGELRININWKTYDQHVDTYESASVDQVVCDEEPPQEIYDALKVRLLDSLSWGNGWFKSQLTPTKGKGWSIEKFWHKKTPNVFTLQMSTYDNAINLGGVDAVRELELGLPAYERAARIYGIPTAKYGYVLDKYVDVLYPNGHLLKPFQPDWGVMTPWESIDHGYTTTSVGFYAVAASGEKYRYAEVYVHNHTVEQVKREVYFKRRQYQYDRPYLTMIDPSVRRREGGIQIIDQYLSKERNVWVGKGMEPTEAYMHNLRLMVQQGRISDAEFHRRSQQVASREGYISYPLAVSPAVNKREAGWELFNSQLTFDNLTNRPRFYVTENCVEFRREARTCRIKEGRDGKVGKGVVGDDHALDEARYFLMASPVHIKGFNGIIRKSRLLNSEGQRRVRNF